MDRTREWRVRYQREGSVAKNRYYQTEIRARSFVSQLKRNGIYCCTGYMCGCGGQTFEEIYGKLLSVELSSRPVGSWEADDGE